MERYEKLLEILKLQATDNIILISRYILNEIDKLGIDFEVDAFGNIIVNKTHGAVAVACHMDTVHTWVDDYEVLGTINTRGDKLIYSHSGVGGDDKCGVFICLELLKKHKNIMAVFFNGEESGCIGSSGISLDCFRNINFILGFDRKNGSDIITEYGGSSLCSKVFLKDIKNLCLEYGFVETFGNITDVIQLKQRGLKVSAVNISCGYYLPHTKSEYININELFNALDFGDKIIEHNKNKRYNHTVKVSYKKPKFKSYFEYSFNTRTSEKEESLVCDMCQYNLASKKLNDWFLCDECFKEFNL